MVRVAHDSQAENTDGLMIREIHLPTPAAIELEPAGRVRSGAPSATATVRAKHVTALMAGLLIAVLAGGAVVFATHCGQAALFDGIRGDWEVVAAPATAVDGPVWTGDGLALWLGPSGRSDDGTWFRPMTPAQ